MRMFGSLGRLLGLASIATDLFPPGFSARQLPCALELGLAFTILNV
jgi:hypothetical protein